MSTPLLETRNLTMRFGGVSAVDSVDFSLGETELRCLIGPNGAGKSTFFKMVSGQLRPTAGTITFCGESVAKAGAFRMAQLGLGVKTQVPNVFNGLSVRENLEIAALRGRSSRRARALADSVIDRIKLGPIASAQVDRLAHGQRQWVEIGMVLAQEPKLILLDEPAAGMTHDEVVRTAELIKEINRSTPLIVVEHDMQFIRMIASTVTVFNQGKVLVEDTVANVLSNPVVRDVYLGKQRSVA